MTQQWCLTLSTESKTLVTGFDLLCRDGELGAHCYNLLPISRVPSSGMSQVTAPLSLSILWHTVWRKKFHVSMRVFQKVTLSLGLLSPLSPL